MSQRATDRTTSRRFKFKLWSTLPTQIQVVAFGTVSAKAKLFKTASSAIQQRTFNII